MSVIVETEPILSHKCVEKTGTYIRSVRLLTFDRENLWKFWEKTRVFKTIFSHEFNEDFDKFCTLLMHEENGMLVANGVFWVIDDFIGVFYMTNISPETDAEVHFTFFDRRYRGRVELTKSMLRYGFNEFNFRRLTCEIPYYATEAPHNFAKLLGFKFEGRKRKAIKFNGDWFDVAIYGILKEDICEESSVINPSSDSSQQLLSS